METRVLTLTRTIILVCSVASINPAQTLTIRGDAAAHFGGRLIVARRAEPKTLNPLIALDVVSREIIGLLNSDLIHIDRCSFETVPALAARWTISQDRRHYSLHLRQGVRFSDGYPFDADDVLFTFQVNLDERVHSQQRDLLIVGGKPISARKIDNYTVEFDLATPYPVVERLFDGIEILPKHLLEKSYLAGKLDNEWGVTTGRGQIAGLGPFQIKEYVPGERLTLDRNPYYWKTDSKSQRLPDLDEIAFVFTGTEDGQVLRLLSGETDLLDGLSAESFDSLRDQQEQRGFQLHDLGPSLEYTYLLLNQNDLSSRALPSIQRKQAWFRQVAFRRAISAAIDREAIVRLVYRGRAAPLWAHVTEGNKVWVNRRLAHAGRSLETSRDFLRMAGFRWNSEGKLVDSSSQQVHFSILTSAGNLQRNEIATLICDDLKQLGIAASVVSLEFRAMMDRVFNTYEYEAAIMTLASGDTDPNSEMNVWTTGGSAHVWNLSGPAGPEWEREIDRLMRRQLVAQQFTERKGLYDRIQQLVADDLPIICLVSPHLLVATSKRLGNVRPAILRPYLLWNADELFLQQPRDGG
jgi:peptide/nickel transport system substrate-binding protein